jgi:hypothetical protein
MPGAQGIRGIIPALGGALKVTWIDRMSTLRAEEAALDLECLAPALRFAQVALQLPQSAGTRSTRPSAP